MAITTGRLTKVTILFLLAVCVSRPCFAELKNNACALKKGWPITGGWEQKFGADSRQDGTEKILYGATFANLASFDDFSTVNPDYQTFVEPGTRYFLYKQDYMNYHGNQNRQRKPLQLVLLENGLCVFLTGTDVSQSIDRVAKQQELATDNAAIVTKRIGPFECGTGRVWLTPGEFVGVINEELDQAGQIGIKVSKDDENKKRQNCELKISKDSVSSIINLTAGTEWEKVGAFRPARFKDFLGLWKRCDHTYKSVDDAKIKLSEGVGVKWFVFNLGEEGSIGTELEQKIELGSKVDYKDLPYKDPKDNTFYWTRQFQCPGGQEETFYEFSGLGSNPVIWNETNVKAETLKMNDAAKDINLEETTKRPIVTCPAQYRANMELLQSLGAGKGDSDFILAQIGQWKGPTQSNGLGLECQR